ncbi:MAG: response regulator [Clostridium sp.]|nr:response regulator [Clostridium sp.]
MKKVLVVDDTKNIRNLLSTCLEIRGYEVTTVDSGIEALNVINDKNIDINLIFLDIRMPGISGTEVLKVIKRERENCPVIIMTAFATVKNAIECTKLGALIYLQKPFSTDRINMILDEFEGENGEFIEEKNEKDILEEVKLIIDKNYIQAHELLKKALAMDPYNKEIYLLISKVNEKLNNKERARIFSEIYKLF